MAISTSFFLVYTKAHIQRHGLENSYVGIRCEVRYTPDALPWAMSRSLGRKVERIQFMLDVRVMPKWWAHGRARPQHPDAHIVNNRADLISQRAVRLHSEYLESGTIPNKEEFMLSLLGKEQAEQAGSLLQDFERYCQYMDRRASEIFAKAQRRTMLYLKDFDTWRGSRVTYGEINRTFASEFSDWLKAHKIKARHKGKNPDVKYIGRLIMFLNHATKEGWNTSLLYKQIKIKEHREAFPIFLEDAEVRALLAIGEKEIAGIAPKERAHILLSRDWFVLATQTAIRYVDWDPKRIKVVAVADGKNIHIYQKKTTYPLEIPLSEIAEAIMDRHGGKMPPPYGPATTIRHINNLCRLLGMNKHMGTHTARRTFINLQEMAGVPRSVIMRISGHRTERDYLKYMGITMHHNAAMLRKANPEWFKAGAA